MKGEAARRLAVLGDPRQLRALWLRYVSDVVDGQMRSSVFLHWLWCGLTAVSAVQSFRSHHLRLLSMEPRSSVRPEPPPTAPAKPDASN